MNHTGILNVDDLPAEIRTAKDASPPEDKKLISLDQMEAQYVKKVIQAVDGNMSRAAEILRVDRRTLYRMIDRHGLWTDRLRSSGAESDSD